jgi:hypothetical protein
VDHLKTQVRLKEYLYFNKLQMFLEVNKMEVKSKVEDQVSNKIQALDNWFQLALLGEFEFNYVCKFLSKSNSINGLSDIYTCTLKNTKFLFKSEEDLFALKTVWFDSLINKNGLISAEIKRYKSMARMAEHVNFLFFHIGSDGEFLHDFIDQEVENPNLLDKETGEHFLLKDWKLLKFDKLYQTYKSCFSSQYKFHPNQILSGKVAEIPLNVSISYKAFLKEIEKLKKLFFPKYSISLDIQDQDLPFTMVDGAKEKYFSLKVHNVQGTYKLGNASVFTKQHEFLLLILDVPQHHTEKLDYNEEIPIKLIVDIIESFIYNGKLDCAVIIFVNWIQNGIIAAELKEKHLWFKYGQWFKPTVSLNKSNDFTFTNQLEPYLLVSKQALKNKIYKKKPDFASALDADTLGKSVVNTYEGSLLIPMNGVISKIKDQQGGILNHFQKPQDLWGIFIDCFSSPGDTILEYCAGSGTGLVASVERNRNYLSFDNNENQFRGCNSSSKVS